MEKQILELLIGIQNDLKEVNVKLDKLDFKMNDGFETLEILSKNNSSDLNNVKIQVAKLEKRVIERNPIN